MRNFPSPLFVHSFDDNLFKFSLKSILGKDKVDFPNRLLIHSLRNKIFEFELRSIFCTSSNVCYLDYGFVLVVKDCIMDCTTLYLAYINGLIIASNL